MYLVITLACVLECQFMGRIGCFEKWGVDGSEEMIGV